MTVRSHWPRRAIGSTAVLPRRDPVTRRKTLPNERSDSYPTAAPIAASFIPRLSRMRRAARTIRHCVRCSRGVSPTAPETARRTPFYRPRTAVPHELICVCAGRQSAEDGALSPGPRGCGCRARNRARLEENQAAHAAPSVRRGASTSEAPTWPPRGTRSSPARRPEGPST
jgi:hypothetical protein